MPSKHFQVEKQEGLARKGRLLTAHGIVETPAFMPVGTYGAVKGLSPEEVAQSGSQILLGNTYHLYLRPGLEVFENAGGLHKFMGWSGPILTDSGGFQVFSLSTLNDIDEKGVRFRSHLNGDLCFLTPELSAEIQQTLGSDIAMAFDQCPALPASTEKIEESVKRSLQWAERFLQVPQRNPQLRFGIVQGGTNPALRQMSLEGTLAFPWDGIAVGGLSVGEPQSEMLATLDLLGPGLPSDLPHYLMGVGTPLDILEAVYRGIDMFDCVLPTRNARNGGFFTDEGLLNIRNNQYRLNSEPISKNCECPCCRQFSRSYLRHLFNVKEMLGCRLATLHNLHYYQGLMSEIRKALQTNSFEAFYQAKLPGLRSAYAKKEVAVTTASQGVPDENMAYL